MANNKISPGKNLPHSINVVIEIPAHSDPVKYEEDKDTGLLVVNRFMATAMRYPCNYGYIPQTLSEDGDPVDVLVITPFPLFSHSVIACRPIGMLEMEDEAGNDNKILAVPNGELTDLYKHVETPENLPKSIRHSIRHFFEHYKDLEEGKWVKVEGWCDTEAAYAEILAGVERYKE